MTLKQGGNPVQSRAQAGRKTLSKRIPRIGKVVFEGNADAVPCTVREFSKSSAVITMTGWLAMPSSFSLYVEPDSIRAQCRVIQRKGNNIQLEFTEVEERIRYRNGMAQPLGDCAA